MADALSPKGKLDLSAASDLHAAFVAHPGGDVVLDLAEVSQMGALCLQVCVSAAKTLQGQGHQLDIVNTSDTVLAQLGAMGLTPQTLAEGV